MLASSQAGRLAGAKAGKQAGRRGGRGKGERAMERYRNLEVWQLADALALEIYRETKHFPRDEVYGITAQLRRAALSVPTNIAAPC